MSGQPPTTGNGMFMTMFEVFKLHIPCSCQTYEWSKVLAHFTPWQLYRIEEILGRRIFTESREYSDYPNDLFSRRNDCGMDCKILLAAIEQVLQEEQVFDQARYLELVERHKNLLVYLENEKKNQAKGGDKA